MANPMAVYQHTNWWRFCQRAIAADWLPPFPSEFLALGSLVKMGKVSSELRRNARAYSDVRADREFWKLLTSRSP